MGRCCISCFADEFIREYIRQNSSETGECDYCSSKRRRLVDVSELADYFHNLIGMYDESDDGYTLESLVQDEWMVFSDKLHCSVGSGSLLEAILNSNWDDDSGEPQIDANNTYVKGETLEDIESWHNFCDEVKEIPETEPEFGELFNESLGVAEKDVHAGAVFHRARLGWSGLNAQQRRVPYQGAEIGAPPAAKAGPGRANRVGRVVLYAAESQLTAISEVRPARGFWVSTCQVRTCEDLHLLDLVDGIPKLNPFIQESLAWYVEFNELLRDFAEALSTPLARSDDVVEYLPSQRLCEYVEKLGYHGVRYPSALAANGVNIVFFDPSKLDVLDSRLVEVTSVTVGFHTRT